VLGAVLGPGVQRRACEDKEKTSIWRVGKKRNRRELRRQTSLSSRKIYNAVDKQRRTEAQSKAWEGRGIGKPGNMEKEKSRRRAGVAVERPME